MITNAQARKIDPGMKDLTDEELNHVLGSLYELGHAIFDVWKSGRGGVSKNPLWVGTDILASGTMGKV